jgi:hypothetical protein
MVDDGMDLARNGVLAFQRFHLQRPPERRVAETILQYCVLGRKGGGQRRLDAGIRGLPCCGRNGEHGGHARNRVQ